MSSGTYSSQFLRDFIPTQTEAKLSILCCLLVDVGPALCRLVELLK